MNPWLFTIPIAYLLGSIPFGYLLVRIFRKQDIRASGSGNIGATNVARSGAKGLGILTLLLDLGKALLAVLIARHLSPANLDLPMGAAIAAILGHVFPVWLGFSGGKGVASALGIIIGLAPLASLCVLGVFLAVVLTTRYVSLASIIAAASFPVFGLLFLHHPSHFVLFGLFFIPALVCIKHQANIRRLLSGTESRFGQRKAAA